MDIGLWVLVVDYVVGRLSGRFAVLPNPFEGLEQWHVNIPRMETIGAFGGPTMAQSSVPATRSRQRHRLNTARKPLDQLGTPVFPANDGPSLAGHLTAFDIKCIEGQAGLLLSSPQNFLVIDEKIAEKKKKKGIRRKAFYYPLHPKHNSHETGSIPISN